MPRTKKGDADRHKTPRINVALPEPWHAIARKLASKTKQPIVYYIITLLEQAAEGDGLKDLPPRPWSEEQGVDD